MDKCTIFVFNKARIVTTKRVLRVVFNMKASTRMKSISQIILKESECGSLGNVGIGGWFGLFQNHLHLIRNIANDLLVGRIRPSNIHLLISETNGRGFASSVFFYLKGVTFESSSHLKRWVESHSLRNLTSFFNLGVCFAGKRRLHPSLSAVCRNKFLQTISYLNDSRCRP